MRAAAITHTGPWSNIHVLDLPRPTPEPGGVLVRSSRAAVNHVDTFVRDGSFPTPLPLPFVVGRDVVGTVEELGDGVTGMRVGDRVWSCGAGHRGIQGPTAEFVAVPAARVYPAPASVDPTTLVALAHAGTTAHLALFAHGHLAGGQGVVVLGAGGQVGRALVTWSRLAGADVGAVCHPRHHADLATACTHGMADPGDTDAVTRVLDSARPHLVVDASGNPDLPALTDAMRPGGRLVLLAGRGAAGSLPVGDVYLKHLTITGFTISATADTSLRGAASALAVRVGDFPAPRVRVLPLSETATAHRWLGDGTAAGEKLVIDVTA